jgi:hypothetical protein
LRCVASRLVIDRALTRSTRTYCEYVRSTLLARTTAGGVRERSLAARAFLEKIPASAASLPSFIDLLSAFDPAAPFSVGRQMQQRRCRFPSGRQASWPRAVHGWPGHAASGACIRSVRVPHALTQPNPTRSDPIDLDKRLPAAGEHAGTHAGGYGRMKGYGAVDHAPKRWMDPEPGAASLPPLSPLPALALTLASLPAKDGEEGATRYCGAPGNACPYLFVAVLTCSSLADTPSVKKKTPTKKVFFDSY